MKEKLLISVFEKMNRPQITMLEIGEYKELAKELAHLVKIPTEKESELEADARYPTEKHLEDYNKGANDGWNECYEWIMEKIK